MLAPIYIAVGNHILGNMTVICQKLQKVQILYLLEGYLEGGTGSVPFARKGLKSLDDSLREECTLARKSHFL